MTWDHRRTEWQTAAEPVTGPRFVWSKLQRIVIHWNGGALRTPYDTAQVLRNQQHAYLTQKQPPYSLGYNDAIDDPGESWEIRGEDIKCAANVEVNESSYAIQVLVYSPTGDTWSPANDAQIDAIRKRVARIREVAGWKVPIVGHFDVAHQSTHTPCPGPAIRQQIADGVFEPVEYEQPTHPEADPQPQPDPEPQPPAGGLELIAMYQIALTYAPGTLVCRVTADELIHEVDADAAAVDLRAGVHREPVGWEEFVAMCRSRRTVGDPFGQPGSEWYDENLATAWAAAQG
jgi:hypothetical protein